VSELGVFEKLLRGEFRDVWVGELADRKVWLMSGADRVRYLNGQVTSNVSKLGIWESQPACLTTAKGKLCAELRVTAAEDGFWLDADVALEETLPARLERYLVADAVHLSVLEGWRLFHWLGETVPPDGVGRCVRSDRYGVKGWDIWVREGQDSGLRGVGGLVWRSAEDWERLRVEAGVPRWGYELGENVLPPEAGLDRTHIDYHKGCYVGQEVISRLKSVGHVNRSLVGLEGGPGLKPGMELWSSDGEIRSVGVVTSVVESFALEKTLGLGYLRRGVEARNLVARWKESPETEVPVKLRALHKAS
jgi:folate-binding protein YgfZ